MKELSSKGSLYSTVVYSTFNEAPSMQEMPSLIGATSSERVPSTNVPSFTCTTVPLSHGVSPLKGQGVPLSNRLLKFIWLWLSFYFPAQFLAIDIHGGHAVGLIAAALKQVV